MGIKVQMEVSSTAVPCSKAAFRGRTGKVGKERMKGRMRDDRAGESVANMVRKNKGIREEENVEEKRKTKNDSHKSGNGERRI